MAPDIFIGGITVHIKGDVILSQASEKSTAALGVDEEYEEQLRDLRDEVARTTPMVAIGASADSDGRVLFNSVPTKDKVEILANPLQINPYFV